MTERKDIDRLFQEKFKDFEAAPPEQVWDAIEEELRKKEDKRRVIPFWFRLAGAAAALLIGFLIVNHYFFSGEQENAVAVENELPKFDTPDSPNNIDKTYSDSGETRQPAEDERTEKLPLPNKNIEAVANGDNSDSGEAASNPSDKPNRKRAEGVTQMQESAVANSGEIKAQKSIGNKKFQTSTNRKDAVALSSKEKNKNTKVILPSDKNPIVSSDRLGQATNRKDEVALSSKEKSDKNSNGVSESDKNQIVSSDKSGKQEKSTVDVNDVKKPQKSDNPSLFDPKSNLAANTQKDSLAKTQDKVAENAAENKKDTMAVAAVPNALEELLKEKEKKEVTPELKLNRWQITSNVAPIYFNSTTNGSPLDSRFQANNKTYKPTVSYGVGVQYAINKKLSVRTGVNTLAMEYNTSDVVFFQTPNARRLENLRSNIQGSLLEIDNKPTEFSQQFEGRADTKFDGMLNQKTGYIEVPVEMTYSILKRKLGIDVIGGVSTLFLNQNEVSLISAGMGMNIGEADNLNAVHFSTNLGLGIKYKLWKALELNLNPMVKYQLNTYSNNAGNFKPYFFGLYSGLSYRF